MTEWSQVPALARPLPAPEPQPVLSPLTDAAIRHQRMDLCFEFVSQVMLRLAAVTSVADEVHGFRYFDERDLLGFVDGTENPVGAAAGTAALVGDSDPDFTGGSYLIVQKYLHDMPAWNAERQILRANMPFGEVGRGEFGTYYAGYAAPPSVTEQMLVNMFIGNPPGNHDRILDFSTAVTGCLFFVPSADFLADLPDPPGSAPAPAAAGSSPAAGTLSAAGSSPGTGSLGIGSLKRST